MGDEKTEEYMTVKQVCDLTMATAEQLRYWNSKGLLVPKRTGEDVANNRKLYSQDDVQKVREILLYKHLGFELKEIKELFEAPKERREALVAERNRALREEYIKVSKKINFVSTAEVMDPGIIASEAEMLGSYDLLDDEYEQNENLKMLTRWMRSHSIQDQNAFSEELKESLEQFERLKGNGDWRETEIQIAKFCDMWAKRFGWPTIGQMYLLSSSFKDMDFSQEEDGSIFSESDLNFISDTFHLAWISASLELLDDILVSFYFKWIENGNEAKDESEPSRIGAMDDFGELLCAFLGEIGNNPYLFSEANREREDQIGKISDLGARLLRVLEDAALDKDVEDYLHLENFVAVTGESLQLAKDVLQGYLHSRTEAWLCDGGKEEIERCMSEWVDALQVVYMEDRGSVATAFNEPDADSSEEEWGMSEDRLYEADADSAKGDNIPSFSDWVECYYFRVLDDPPEVSWSTEDEKRATEKRCRELF